MSIFEKNNRIFPLPSLADVLIVNRYEYHERLTNFEVRVGINTDNLQNPTCHDRVGTVGQGQFLTVQCDPPIPGRYVSIQMFGEGILTLCEVFVYSRVGELSSLILTKHGFAQKASEPCLNFNISKVGCLKHNHFLSLTTFLVFPFLETQKNTLYKVVIRVPKRTSLLI